MVDEVTPDALKDRLDRGEDVQIVDIRQPGEFAAGHIPGAENVPFHRFARDVATPDWGEEIVVVCPIGESSLQAARLLEAYEGVGEDATVANLVGGYRDWDYELEAGAAAVEE
jgi:thiosulfate/3-mercaptopyruvate sulfurtransferase